MPVELVLSLTFCMDINYGWQHNETVSSVDLSQSLGVRPQVPKNIEDFTLS